jgi:hypothetical protein
LLLLKLLLLQLLLAAAQRAAPIPATAVLMLRPVLIAGLCLTLALAAALPLAVVLLALALTLAVLAAIAAAAMPSATAIMAVALGQSWRCEHRCTQRGDRRNEYFLHPNKLPSALTHTLARLSSEFQAERRLNRV